MTRKTAILVLFSVAFVTVLALMVVRPNDQLVQVFKLLLEAMKGLAVEPGAHALGLICRS